MFDTRDATDRLKGAGANDELAREIVNLFKEQADQAVTKELLDRRFELLGKDLKLMEERLENKLELVEERLENKLGQVENDLGGRVRTWVAAGTGIIALLMTLFEFIN